MNSDLWRKLSSARATLDEQEWLDRRIQNTAEERRAAGDKMGELSIVLTEEEQDVEKLKSLGLRSIYLSLIGDKEEQLEKEKAEAAAARLKYEAAKAEFDAIGLRASALRKLHDELGDPKRRYQELLELQKVHLVAKGGAVGQALADRIDQQGHLTERLRELDASIESGTEALNIMAKMLGYLAEASSLYAAFTRDSSGAAFGKTAARQALGHAYVDAVDGKIALAKFQNQLGVTLSAPEVNLPTAIVHLADLAVDTIVDDIATFSRARQAAASVEESMTKVESLLSQIRPVRDRIANDLAAVEERIAGLLEEGPNGPYR